MDRIFVYPSEQPVVEDWLGAEKNKMVALGYLAQGVLGTNTVVDGLTCSPTSPASLAVTISNGSIYQVEPTDVTSYGTLVADQTHQIVKQGIAQDVPNITFTPPGTSGQAINYIIQAQFSEIDTANEVNGFFNPQNPDNPLSGPNGSGANQPTIRQGTITINAKAGTAATAGSQVTPTPDAGYVGLWVVTVANGATTLTSSQIAQYPSAPFISVKLPQVPGFVQGGTWEWATDTGTANQVVINLNPIPGTIQAGFEAKFKKVPTASNGPMTVIVNGAPPVALVNADGSALSATAFIPGNYRTVITFDGTSWTWTNSNIATGVGSLNASAGEGISVTPSGTNAIVAINYPGLTVEPNIANTDLWSFYSQADVHHRVVSSAQLLAWLRLNLPIKILSVPLTYYVGPAGNDNNDGLTAATAFATIQKAIVSAASFTLNNANVTINILDGSNYTPFSSLPVNGSGLIQIVGNNTTPSSVIVHATSQEAIYITNPQYKLSGFTVQSDARGAPGHFGSGIRVHATTQIGRIQFNACFDHHIFVGSGGTVLCDGPQTGDSNAFLTIAGAAPYHLSVGNGTFNSGQTILNINPGTYVFTGAFINVDTGVAFGSQVVGGTFYSAINNSGTVQGVRYVAQNGGIIKSGTGSPPNQTYFPGNSLGITNNNGLYV